MVVVFLVNVHTLFRCAFEMLEAKPGYYSPLQGKVALSLAVSVFTKQVHCPAHLLGCFSALLAAPSVSPSAALC